MCMAPRTLFAGLLRCASCSGPLIAVDARRYGCARHLDRGPSLCPSAVAVGRRDLELRLLGDLRAELLQPDALRDAQRAVREALASQARAAGAGGAAAEARLEQLGGEISRLADAVAQAGLSQALRERLASAEAEQALLRAQLQQVSRTRAPAVDAEAIAATWRRMVMDLGTVIAGEDRDRARGLLADLIGPVTIGIDEASGHVYAESERPAERLLVQAVGAPMGVVAGARIPSRRRILLPRRR